jgi:hypothetical protein
MFINYLFSSLSDLNKSTRLLEACDWSEERMEDLLIFCTSAVQEVSISEDLPTNYSDFEGRLKSYLLGSHTENEIDILLEIIRDDLVLLNNMAIEEN